MDDLCSYAILLEQYRKNAYKIQGCMGLYDPDLCTASAMLHQLGYWANSELVITQVYDKPKDGEYMWYNYCIFFQTLLLLQLK